MEDETLLTWVKSGEIAIPESSARLSGKGVRSVTYAAVRIQIAFHPLEEKFEVFNPLITKNVGWIDDVARVFTPDADLFDLTDAYSAKNPDADRKEVGKVLQKLRMIINNHIGLIELAEDLDIQVVTEIFTRIIPGN